MKASKIITIHQPFFMPWLGFFDKMAKADLFVLLDDAQFEKNSVLNRNKIKIPNGWLWLTIPVKGHLSEKILDVQIDETKKWRKDHLKSIYYNYKKAKNFPKIFPKIEKLYQKKESNLAKFNFLTIKFLASELKLKPNFKFSSNLHLNLEGSLRILEIVKSFKGKEYFSGVSGKKYLDLQSFRDAGIKIKFQDFHHPSYEQLWGKFLPQMSALDYLLCDGRPLLKILK